MDELEIKGRFGVEIHDKDGNLVNKVESGNIVSNLGILQIKRWLDRTEHVDNPSVYSNWDDSVVVAGECRKMTCAVQNMTYTSSGMNDYPDTYSVLRCFDGSYDTQWRWYQDNNNTEYIEIKFPNSIHLKRLGMYVWTDWQSTSLQQTQSFRIKIEGFTVASAGTSGYNSAEYLREFALYNGYPAYKKEGSAYYIFVNVAGTKWQMSTSLGGTIDYQTTDLTLPAMPSLGTWSYAGLGGLANAPTVTEGTTVWREPFFMAGGNREATTTTNGQRWMPQWYNDDQILNVRTGNYYQDIAKVMYCTYSLEGITGWYNSTYNYNHNWYGFIPFVKTIRYEVQSWDWYSIVHIPEIDVYEAIMHPQNPYALKLGTDDGSILPLAVGNTTLGAYSSGNQWKCDSVTQNSYTVRFSRRLLPEEANGVTFKEIGLFGNLDGHLVANRTEPTLANASGLFARAVFGSSWSKTSDQTATIYYDISVADNT